MIHPEKFSLLCSSTAEFADGQISISGEFPPTDPDSSGAITGGTGAYEDVGGEVTVAPSDTGTLLLNFFLVP